MPENTSVRDPYSEVRRRVAAGEVLDLSQALVPAGRKELTQACEIVTGSRRTPDGTNHELRSHRYSRT